MGFTDTDLQRPPAIASELSFSVSLDAFDELSGKTPCICAVIPNGPYNVVDLDEAGEVKAIMKELSSMPNLDVLTVNGKTLGENIKDAEILNKDVIRLIENPIFGEGGLTVLRGESSAKRCNNTTRRHKRVRVEDRGTSQSIQQ